MALLMGVEMCLVYRAREAGYRFAKGLKIKIGRFENLPIFILQPQGSVPVVTFQLAGSSPLK